MGNGQGRFLTHGAQGRGAVAGLVACLALAGCFGSGDGFATRDAGALPDVGPAPALDGELTDGSRSEIIDALLARRSVLAEGPLREVAGAVLAANSRAAEAELRAAMLRSEAEEKNWLPTLGPQVSLTSMGDAVSRLVLDAVLFDHGGKRAQRAYARADVEVAAAALAVDTNDRVLTALELYLAAEAARSRAAVNAAALSRMERLAYIMEERVAAGVSDRADLALTRQTLNGMQNDLASDREAEAAALAELQAMSARPVANLRGISDISTPDALSEPLSVMKARAEAERAVAAAQAARAGLLPGVSVSGSTGSEGGAAQLNVGGAGLGLGTPARLRATEAEEAAASARTAQAVEEARRTLAALDAELVAAERQAAEARVLAAEAAETFAHFAAQQEAGRRAVPEVVTVFETKVRTERSAVSSAYEVAALRLRRAALTGSLVDGAEI